MQDYCLTWQMKSVIIYILITVHKTKQSHLRQILFLCKIWGSHGSDHEDWNVMSSNLADSYEHLGKTGCLHLQSRRGIFYIKDEGNICPPNICNYIPDYMAPLFKYCSSVCIYCEKNKHIIHWTLWTYTYVWQGQTTLHIFDALAMECCKNMPLSFIMSVCLSTCNKFTLSICPAFHTCNSSRTGERIFMTFYTGEFY